MDRLTRYDKEDNCWTLFCGEESGDACLDKNEQAMCEDANEHCAIFAPCPVEQNAIDRLAAYEDIGTPEELAGLVEKKKAGLLVELPCKIGTKIFEANRHFGKIFQQIAMKENMLTKIVPGWGTRYFATPKEAEAALAVKEGE